MKGEIVSSKFIGCMYNLDNNSLETWIISVKWLAGYSMLESCWYGME